MSRHVFALGFAVALVCVSIYGLGSRERIKFMVSQYSGDEARAALAQIVPFENRAKHASMQNAIYAMSDDQAKSVLRGEVDKLGVVEVVGRDIEYGLERWAFGYSFRWAPI